MAFAALVNTYTAWMLANRAGSAPGGSPGTALVSDLIVGDWLVGARATVTALGTTTSGVRTLTLGKISGASHSVQWVAASSVVIIRP